MPTPLVAVSQFQNGITEYYGKPFTARTYIASAAIVAGQLLEFTGDKTVAPTGTGGGSVITAGVAMHDAANGAAIVVGMDGTFPMTAQGAITAGARLKSGTVAGTVAAAGATPDARAVCAKAEAAIADTAVGPVTILGMA